MRLQQQAFLVAVLFLALAAARPTGDHRYQFDVQRSAMTVFVYKQGFLSFAADNHEVDVPIVAGSYDSRTETVELTVDAAKMKVLDPKLSSGPRDDVQANMAGSQVLDVVQYPKISFRSTKIDMTRPGKWMVNGDLTLHGQTHAIVVSVVTADPTHFSGSAMVKQSAFGITPIRLMGGSVSVKDDVKVVFEIQLVK